MALYLIDCLLYCSSFLICFMTTVEQPGTSLSCDTQVQLADFRMDGMGAWMVDGSCFKKGAHVELDEVPAHIMLVLAAAALSLGVYKLFYFFLT